MVRRVRLGVGGTAYGDRPVGRARPVWAHLCCEGGNRIVSMSGWMDAMVEIREPALGSQSFNCPHCGALAAQRWFSCFAAPASSSPTPIDAAFEMIKLQSLPLQDQGIARRDLIKLMSGTVFLDKSSEVKRSLQNVRNLYLSRCYSCGDFATWLGNNVFPRKNFEILINEDMPTDARADFEEATAIVDASPRGAAALLRLSIQKICIFLGEKGNNLNEDIGNLVGKGLSDKIQKALDAVRVIGNNAVHPGTIDMSDDRQTAATLFKLVNFIAEAMISQPKQIDQVYSQLPRSALDAIQRRDRKS
jgi:Domain of unknown function (DUF4145)